MDEKEITRFRKLIETFLKASEVEFQAVPYDERVVDRFEDAENEILVSTALVTDAELPYETAIAHPEYNEGKIIVVETYGTKEFAQEGHNRWVKTITTEPLPENLTCKGVAASALILDAFSDDDLGWRIFPRKRKTS